MTRTIATAAALAALMVPATAAAKPSKADKQEARSECQAERGTTDATREAFAVRYDNWGDCVRQRARAARAERRDARENAAQACREERGTTAESRQAFKDQYGENANKKHAFGKCVSEKARAARDEEDAEDSQQIEERQNAAEQCDAERGETPDSRQAFRDQYGTNANKKNAFGKCVSEKARTGGDD